MIYTVTLNPSIDYTVRLNCLNLGMTNRTDSEDYFVGGKGINVSCVLSQLGLDSTALGFVGGFTGDEIERELKNKGINTDFVRVKGGASRINIKLKTDAETEINGGGPEIKADEFEKLLCKIDKINSGDTLIISGSIPRSLPDNAYEKILGRLGKKRVRIVVDATGEPLLSALRYKPFLIKPNRTELEELFGADINNDKDIEKYAKLLQQKGAKNVLVSLGKDGALLLDELGTLHRQAAAKGKAVSTVGAGDSMVAGFVAGYERTADYDYALKSGSACGSATAFSKGLATREMIEKLL